MKTGVLHAGITEVVEELDAVDSQHGGQRVGMASPSGRRVAEPAPAKAGGRMRSSGFCQGIGESIRSRACPRENGGTVPGGSCASCPGIPNPQTACPRENGGRLVHLPLPPTSIPYRTSASPALLCHITTDLFRGFLNQSQGEMRRWWGSYDGAGAFSKYGPQGFTGATQLMIIAT